MRKYRVEAEVVDGMFPDKGREAQRRLLSESLHLDVAVHDDHFIVWSRSLVRFRFQASLVPYGKNDPDVNVFNMKLCPLIPGDKELFQERRRHSRLGGGPQGNVTSEAGATVV